MKARAPPAGRDATRRRQRVIYPRRACDEMASIQKGKKVVNQEDLRRFMKEKKLSSERQKRVDSPHAKYNSLGQLSCALCNAPVRSALLWQTHVLGKQHKDKVSQLKNRDSTEAAAASSSSSSALKRPAPEPASTSGKRAKLPLTGGAGAVGGQPEETASSSRHSAGLGLLAGLYGDGDDDEEAKDGVPADFFDNSVFSVSHSSSVSKPDDGEESATERKDHAAEALPEGFFDDPVRDAKVRQVDTPRDQMDKEWEEFQKEMRQVNSASDAIVAEDDEEGRLERQIDEINEQIECFRRVEVLRTRQEVKSAMERERRQRAEAQPDAGKEEEDEEELMHVLTQDWRAKGALA
ncbi:zinc finger protein 830 isoform X1 [Sinocyclocheilus anshuiensis]|uniref:zinc finger protein 830 isoform X1 n=1 Tax=Sinocyclocheilus anshuiensis TaxID=1608454 RepID=UPI0007B8151E|nr:PREDICTED: zinc finger protein 830 isoform X1 [Sinocyclocheilus anshuiensis]